MDEYQDTRTPFPAGILGQIGREVKGKVTAPGLHPDDPGDRLTKVTQSSPSYRRPAVRARALRTIDRARAAGLCELGKAYLAASNPEAALDVLVRAIVLDALDPGIRMSLATAWYQTGDFEPALTWLEPLRGKGLAALEMLRGQILYDLRRYPEALSAFELARQTEPGLDDSWLRRAATLMAMGNPTGAVSDLNQLLETKSDHGSARMLRATALLELGEAESALSDLEAVEDRDRNPEHVLLLARAKLISGRREAEVEECFTAGLKRFPLDFRLRLAFGRYLASRRGSNPKAARRAIEVLLEVCEGRQTQSALPRIQAEALFLLGELSAEAPEGHQEAEIYFHRGLALLPDDPRGLTGIGALMLEQGRPAHGLPWLLQSVLIDPERPLTLECLAKALAAVPDDEAVARWIGLVTAGLPGQAPTLLAHLLRFVQEAGRADAYEEVRREGHRMKNLVAVLASRPGPKNGSELDKLYREWAAFLDRIQKPSPSPSLLSPARLIQLAVQQAVGDSRRIRCRMPSGLPLVRGNQASLTDALANILRNAVEAYPRADPPGGSIRISARHREGSRWLEVTVTDQGGGIRLEDQQRIFEPGFSRREGGSGLGLAIARRVVMSHGGRIAVTSAPGGPTSFTISLPVATRSSTDQLLRYQTHGFHRLSSGRPGSGPQPGQKEKRHAR